METFRELLDAGWGERHLDAVTGGCPGCGSGDLVIVEDAHGVHETRAAFAVHDALDIVALERGAEHAKHPVDLGIASDIGALQREIEHVR